MKNAMKKLLSLMLVAMLLLSVVPFQAFAADEDVQLAPAQEETSVQSDVPDESTAATEAAVAPAVEEGSVREFPEGIEIGTKAYVYFMVDGEVMKTKQTEVGSSFPSFPSDSDTLKYYGQVNGTSAGWAFKCWTWDEEGTLTVNKSGLKVSGEHLDVQMDENGKYYAEMTVYAQFEEVDQAVSVKLDPKDGKFAPGVSSTIEVEIGKDYPADLPIPTRSGYTFAGWFVKESSAAKERCIFAVEGQSELAEELDVRSTSARPYAKWVKNGYTVTVMWYDFADGTSEGWVDFDASKYTGMSVPSGSTISASTGTFPSDSEISWKDKDTGYTLKGWKFLKSGSEFKPGTTKISVSQANSNGEIFIVPMLRRSVKLIADHPVTYKDYYSKSFTVEIGAHIGELPSVSPCYDSTTKASWGFNEWITGVDADPAESTIATKDNLTKVSEHPEYYPALGKYFYATWVESQRVDLVFHLGSEKNSTIVPCYEIPMTGTFNLSKLDLYKYCPNYSKYDDGVDVRIGWFTEDQWNNYVNGKPYQKVNNVVDLGEQTQYEELHMLLIDKGTDANTYNNNNSTADSTNPKTGDIIMGAVVVLVVSAAALAAVYYVSKKKRTSK